MSSDPVKKETDQSLEEQHRSIKNLSGREVSFLKHLISNYPNFGELSAGDQFDRMILVLQSACGYGAVSERIGKQIQEKLDWESGFEILIHFQNSQYDSHEAGETQTRYRESFEGAFSLKREYMNFLANEGENQSENEPIRKKVPRKEPVKAKEKVTPIAKPKPKAQAKPASSPGPSRSETPNAKASQVVAPKTGKAADSQPPSQSESDSFGFKPWMAFAGIGFVIFVVILAFAIKS